MGYVGLDIGKKTIEVVRLAAKDAKPERNRFATDAPGMARLVAWLNETDIVGFETGSLSKYIASCIQLKVAKVLLLESAQLKMISDSLKKTDREDALKLAKIIASFPEADLPLVHIPSDVEAADRRLMAEHEARVRDRTRQINQLHALFTQAGITDVTRYNLSTANLRSRQTERLPKNMRVNAERTCILILIYESQIEEIKDSMKSRLKEEEEFTRTVFSIPGIGVKASFAWLSQVGSVERFPDAGKLAAYIGTVPGIQESGKSSRQRKNHRGNPALKRILFQSALVLSRSPEAGDLSEFYQRIKAKRGGKRAVVALTRKLVELIYAMQKHGTTFRGSSFTKTGLKLRKVGLM